MRAGIDRGKDMQEQRRTSDVVCSASRVLLRHRFVLSRAPAAASINAKG